MFGITLTIYLFSGISPEETKVPRMRLEQKRKLEEEKTRRRENPQTLES
jgi:hypothetical protein